jgi:hypothetical protein
VALGGFRAVLGMMSEAAGTPVQASGVFNLAAAGLVERLLAGWVHLADERATTVTSTAEAYRAKARECEEHAAQMPDSYKEQLLEIAKKWRTMATFEETHGR